jgi:hypothetical protein
VAHFSVKKPAQFWVKINTQALYSAADQITDRGALLGPGNSLTIRIFQLSALLGRGAPRTVTLSF